MGIETEYGLSVEGKGPEHLAEETARLLRALPFVHSAAWDNSAESPLRDLRGFSASSIRVNPEDAGFDRRGSPPASSPGVKVERLLTNGARLYADHGHPEYATPECVSIADLIAQDRAGERILLACVKALQADGGAGRISLYKNNTDFHGFSYGCHENYLLPRPEDAERFLQKTIPFFVTRQIYAGAGKVGIEEDGGWRKRDKSLPYQLSQRADYFSRLMGIDTLHERPLLNTRDEPHADASRHIRLHVILGDANRSQFACALKAGAAALALRMIAEGWEPALELEDALGALKEISRDPERAWVVRLKEGRKMTAVEIQALHLEEAEKRFSGCEAEVDWILRIWRETLEGLAADPMNLADRLDWPAKLMLLEAYTAETGDRDSAALQSLDLEYHNIDSEASLFAPLEQAGRMFKVAEEGAIEQAMSEAPVNSRARIRGEAVRRFGGQVSSLSWGRLCLGSERVSLEQMVDGSVEQLNRRLEQTTSPKEFLEAIRRWRDDGCQE
jgi:proteasome accessory factor A